MSTDSIKGTGVLFCFFNAFFPSSMLLRSHIGAYNSAGEETWMGNIKSDYMGLEVVVKGTGGQLVFLLLSVRPEVGSQVG